MTNNNNLVETKNNQVLTTSLKVAEKFGKEHKNILKDIRELKEKITSAQNLANLYCEETTYKDIYGRDQKAYEFNKDFFTLLVMGFTGEKALKFKIDYINAFNKMEQALLNQAENKIEENNEISFYFQNKFYNNNKEQKYVINDPILCKNYFRYKIINDRPLINLMDIADLTEKRVLFINEYVGLDYIYNNLLDKNKIKDKTLAYYLHKFRIEYMVIANNNLFEKDVDDKKEISFADTKFLSERLLSATECARILEITPQKFGRITNKLNLKTSEFGEFFKEKTKFGTDCQTFKYKSKVLDTIKNYFL